MTHIYTPIARLAIAAFLAGATPALAQDAKQIEQVTNLLKEADANEDGKTTRAELDAHRADMFDKLDRNNDGIVSEADKPRLRIPRKKFNEAYDKVVPKFDKDGDGTLSKAEWNTQEVDIFELLDANGDGAIAASEIPSAPPADE